MSPDDAQRAEWRRIGKERREAWTPEEHEKQLARVREWRRQHRKMVKEHGREYYEAHVKELAEKRKRRAELLAERRATMKIERGQHEEPTKLGQRRITQDGYEETAKNCTRCGRLAWMNRRRDLICPECFIKQNVKELHKFIDERLKIREVANGRTAGEIDGE